MNTLRTYLFLTVILGLAHACSPSTSQKEESHTTVTDGSTKDSTTTPEENPESPLPETSRPNPEQEATEGISKNCGNTPHGGTETRIRYKEASVPSGGTCDKETQTRTCKDGTWGEFSGSYTHESCTVEGLNAPKIQITSTDTTITEGNPGMPHNATTPRFVSVELRADKGPEEDFMVRLLLSGDAVLYQDYQSETRAFPGENGKATTMVLLKKGQTKLSIKIFVVRDLVKEAQKTLNISIEPRRGLYQVTGKSVNIKFTDDDKTSTATKDGCRCKSGTDEYVLCSDKQLVHSHKTSKMDLQFTWHFQSKGEVVYCGQFLNGDYWLASRNAQPIQMTKIAGNTAGIGAELNPSTDKKAAAFGANNKYGNYDASKDLTKKLPFDVPKDRNHIILAGLQRDIKKMGKCGTRAIENVCVEIYQFLTVLQRVPEGLGRRLLRPALTSDMKKLLHFDRDFDLNRLVMYSKFSNPKHTAEHFEGSRKKWKGITELFTHFSEGGRAFRAHSLVSDYASGMAVAWFASWIYLLDPKFTLKQKEGMLASMMSFGQDQYMIFHHKNGPRLPFGGGAGQGAGRITPILLFGLLRTDPAVAEDVAKIPLQPYAQRPQEYKQLQRNPSGYAIWGDGAPLKDTTPGTWLHHTERRYWSTLFGSKCYDGGDAATCAKATGGKRTTRDPYLLIDGPAAKPGAWYFGINMSIHINLSSFMFQNAQVCDITNFDLSPNFARRVFVEKRVIVENDYCAPPDPRENKDCNVWKGATNCKYYKKTWGPNPNKMGDCIRNNTGGNTGQTGRFSKRKSVLDPRKASYKVWTLLNNFEDLMNKRKSCRGKTKGAKLTPTTASYNTKRTRLSWSHPTKWADGKSFDARRHLGHYRISYRAKSTEPWKTMTTRQNSIELATLPHNAELKIEVCDFINICSTMKIQ